MSIELIELISQTLLVISLGAMGLMLLPGGIIFTILTEPEMEWEVESNRVEIKRQGKVLLWLGIAVVICGGIWADLVYQVIPEMKTEKVIEKR